MTSPIDLTTSSSVLNPQVSAEALLKKPAEKSLRAVALSVWENATAQTEEDVKLLNDRGRELVFGGLRPKQAKACREGLQANLGPFPDAAPRGEAKYTPQQRFDQLNTFTQIKADGLNQLKADLNTAGSSLGCFIVQDYYYFLCHNLDKELRQLKPADYMNWKARNHPEAPPPFRTGDTWKTNGLYVYFHLKMRSFFGSLYSFLDEGSMWHMPINTPRKENGSLVDISLLFLRTAKSDLFLAFIKDKKLPSAEGFANILAWCAECLSQNQALLFNPPTKEFDLSHHFTRLDFRRRLLEDSVRTLEDSLLLVRNPVMDDAEIRKYLQLTVRELSLFTTMYGEKSKSATKQGKKELLDFLLRSKHDQIGWSENRHIKYLEAALSKKRNNVHALSLFGSCHYLMEIEVSLIEEGILTCLAELLDNDTGAKIYPFLNRALLAFEDICKMPLEPIFEKFDLLSKIELNESSRRLFNTLQHAMEPVMVLIGHTEAAIELMEVRLRECQNPTATSLTRALAMRDMQIQCCLWNKKNFVHSRETLLMMRRQCQGHDLHPEVQELFMQIFERVHMGMEVTIGIESYINLFLEDLVKNEAPVEKPTKRKKGKAPRKNKAAPKGGQRGKQPAAVKANSTPDTPPPSWQQSPLYPTLAVQPLEKKTFSNELATISAHVKELRKQQHRHGQLQSFFASNLHNIKHLTRHFNEKESSASFGLDTIFEEMDILRRLMEAALGLGISSSADANQACASVNRIKTFGHELHRYLPLILQDAMIPLNVHMAVHNYSPLVHYFSQTNAAVNYLSSTKGKTNLLTATQQLLDYLAAVKMEAQNPIPREDLRQNLWQMHQTHAELILTFVSELMHSLADPSFKPQAKDLQFLSIDKEWLAEPEAETELEECEANNSQTVAELAPPSIFNRQINTRAQAMQAVDRALLWLKILELHPIKGDTEREMRVERRNNAFENVETSLLWLQEKLDSEDYSTCYTSVLGAMELVRRAHQELNKGLLYHSGKLVQGEHIVKALHLAHSSNPVHLNQLVLQNNPKAEFLPNLLEKKYMWMSDARQALSYPLPPLPRKETIWTTQVRKLSETTKKYYRLRQKTEHGSSVVEGHKTFNAESVLRKIESFTHKEEAEKVFTALEALLQTLEHGI